jgi:hypothetical protein
VVPFLLHAVPYDGELVKKWMKDEENLILAKGFYP